MFGRCQSQNVASVYQVETGAAWQTQDGAYGVISLGPLSPFWSAFIDPVTNKVASSIALARPQTNAVIQSNFTMGSVELSYQGQSNVSLSNQLNYEFPYQWNWLEFGILYSNDSVFTEEYTEQISITEGLVMASPLGWSTTFNGLGLQASVYAQFQDRFYNITNQTANCTSNQCVLPNACSNYTYLNDYFFQLYLTQPVIGADYMRIPFAAFLSDT